MCSVSSASERSLKRVRNNILMYLLVSFAFISCQKEISAERQIPKTENNRTSSPGVQLQASATRIQLLQSNAEKTAVSFRWESFPGSNDGSKSYTIEAAMAGAQFSGFVELGSTNNMFIDFTTNEFNKQIRQLFVTGFAEDIQVRIRLSQGTSEPAYSYGVLLQVTTYHPVITYDEKYSFRIPGNFQNWKPEMAQKIISTKLNEEYEGYINFTNEHSQFLMVKNSSSWSTLATYYYIGANKFGFGGNMFSVNSGAGIYKFNANNDTRTWSYTKIDSWSVTGTAVTVDGNTDLEMHFNASTTAWEITGCFAKGTFIFRANKASAILFGHNRSSEAGIPDYNGEKIEITRAGNYTIGLYLLSAGNYSYSILHNV
jgi:hypothetical protein